MRLLIALLICLPFNELYSQDATRMFYFESVNWELTMPGDFKLNDSAKNVEMQDRGVQFMEKANDIEVGDLSDLITLVSAYKGRFEYFNSTIRKFDRATEGDYDSLGGVVNKVIYNTFLKKLSDAIIDTSSTKMSVDGLVFRKFQLSIIIRQKELFTMVILSKLYKGFDFGITYLYMNAETKNEIENMLKHSKFKK